MVGTIHSGFAKVKTAAKKRYENDRDLARKKSTKAKGKSNIEAGYNASKPSKHRRQRRDLGGTADAHYSRALEFWKMREDARAMDRDDWSMGQLVDRAVANIVKADYTPDPDTGDSKRDDFIRSKWKGWATNARKCDIKGVRTFRDMLKAVCRHGIVDGDSFALNLDDGRIQLKEGQEVSSPNENLRDNVVHGVELDENSAPVRCWFEKPRVGENKLTGYRLKRGEENYTPRDIYDQDNLRQVMHIFDPRRISQHRGVTAFKSVFDVLSMIEDTAFAKLIQTQISACVALFIKGKTDHRFGGRNQETRSDNSLLDIEEMLPGMILRSTDSTASIQGFSPQVVSAEWFQLLKFFLRVIGAQIGMPLTLVLLDTSNTTFHGYRGELEQAKIGFKDIQQSLIDKFCIPVYEWKIREWFPEEWKDLAKREQLLKHTWTTPGWPYVDPLNDVKADSEALRNNLTSPRRALSNRGLDWETVIRETVADRKFAIAEAIKASQEILSVFGVRIPWREILHLAPPPGLSISADRADEFAGDEISEPDDSQSAKGEDDDEDQS